MAAADNELTHPLLEAFCTSQKKTIEEFSEVSDAVSLLLQHYEADIRSAVLHIVEMPCGNRAMLAAGIGLNTPEYPSDVVSDAIADIEFSLADRGWSGVSLFNGPFEEAEAMKKFINWALKQ